MDSDDLDPPPAPTGPVDFDVLSIEALEEHIAALKAEIARAETAIAAKKAARAGAEAVFKS